MGQPTVVLVDDSSDVRTLVRTQILLSRELEVVGEGVNGLDAVELASRYRPDLMLLDVSMPVVDGLAALPKVLAASPHTRVVMYTGFGETGLATRAAELGASGFLQKSVSFPLLLKTLVDLTDREDAPDEQPSPPEAESSEPARLDPVLESHLERFREVFDDAAIGMATMTLAGRLVRANRSLGQLLDTPVEDLVGTAWARIADGSAAIEEALVGLEAGTPAVQVEHGIRDRPDLTVRSTLSAVIDARGRSLYVFLQVQDVSHQAAAEFELRKTEARFRLLVEAVEDYAIFMLDPNGRISSWNAGAQRSNGYSADEIIGQHFRVFYPQDKQESRHPEYELEQARLHGSYEEEGWRLRKDGSRFWASVTITAVRDPDGELVGFAKVTRDTTERREMLQSQEQAARELALANEQLAQANRQLADVAEEQAEFFALTAHELRAPVAILSGASNTLARDFEALEADERSQLTDAVHRSSEQLRRLLGDLMTAARLQARRLNLELRELDLAEHVQSVVATIRQSSRATDIRVTSEPRLGVRADPVRLTQMIDNLVMNALRHGRPPVEVRATGTADTVTVLVLDGGEGVSEDVQAQLFERFATTSSKGTGLGLFLVRELARAHGGDATYRSDDGAFVLTLPRT